jgi:hypothetical protein
VTGTRGRQWAVTLLAVDIALLVVFGVLAVGHFQGDPDSPASPPPTVAATEPVDFRMPSGRVACHMDATRVVCGMNDVKHWLRVEGGGCPGDRVVVLDDAGVRAVCAATVDVPLPDGARRTSFGNAYFPSGTQVLEYERSRTVGGYTCQSRRAGVLCRDADGRWFNLRLQDGLTQGGRDDVPPSDPPS